MMEEIKPEGFEEKLAGAKLALVDFWATWCRPCKAIEPHLVSIAEEFADRGVKVFRLNADENPEFLARLSVFSLPTVLFFKEGKLVDKVVGARTRSDFVKVVEELLE
jgi:thioredoxin 1